jgi:mono/diheme cytochrome c family protein
LPLLSALAAGCDLPGRPKLADRPVPADQVVNFSTLYTTNCAGCHGADGKLGPAPPLNDSLFLAIVPDAELLRVIREGRVVGPGQKTPMPAFALGKGLSPSDTQAQVPAERKELAHVAQQKSPLTPAQVQVLAEGMKKHWGPVASVSASVPPYLAPAGAGSGKHGEGSRALFEQACAGCHGKDGEGVEREGRLRRKIHEPAFLALISDQQLRRYVITGRPDFGMPPYDGKAGRPPDFQPLTSADVGDLVALLAAWRRGGPAGGE